MSRHAFISVCRNPTRKQKVSSDPCLSCQSFVNLLCWDESIHSHIIIRILEKEISCRLLLLIRDVMLMWTTKTVMELQEVAAHVNMEGETAGTVQQISLTHMHSKYNKPQGKPKNNRGGDERKCGNCVKIQHSVAEHCPTRRSTCNTFHKMEHQAQCVR